MRISVGSDIFYIPNLKNLSESGALPKILRPSEILRSSDEHIAGLIALKEASVKALGLNANDWLKITIKRDGERPYIDLLQKDDQITSIDCSVSHNGDYAMAVVTVLYSQNKE